MGRGGQKADSLDLQQHQRHRVRRVEPPERRGKSEPDHLSPPSALVAGADSTFPHSQSPPAQCSQFFEASEAVEEAGVCYL